MPVGPPWNYGTTPKNTGDTPVWMLRTSTTSSTPAASGYSRSSSPRMDPPSPHVHVIGEGEDSKPMHSDSPSSMISEPPETPPSTKTLSGADMCGGQITPPPPSHERQPIGLTVIS